MFIGFSRPTLKRLGNNETTEGTGRQSGEWREGVCRRLVAGQGRVAESESEAESIRDDRFRRVDGRSYEGSRRRCRVVQSGSGRRSRSSGGIGRSKVIFAGEYE